MRTKDPSAPAKEALKPLWAGSELKGRTWGLKMGGKNPYYGSHITIAVGNELVVVISRGRSSLQIRQFKEVENTLLGRDVVDTLHQAGLIIEDDDP